jgi:hypothetical protein
MGSMKGLLLFTQTRLTLIRYCICKLLGGDTTNQSSTLLGKSNDLRSSYRYIWTKDPFGNDDGVCYIYTRAYDKAGNLLVSNEIEIEVDTYKERRTSFPGFLTLLLVFVVLLVTYPKRKKRRG